MEKSKKINQMRVTVIFSRDAIAWLNKEAECSTSPRPSSSAASSTKPAAPMWCRSGGRWPRKIHERQLSLGATPRISSKTALDAAAVRAAT
jgi:hypothetical protein